jgi:hypothetical protein
LDIALLKHHEENAKQKREVGRLGSNAMVNAYAPLITTFLLAHQPTNIHCPCISQQHEQHQQ